MSEGITLLRCFLLVFDPGGITSQTSPSYNDAQVDRSKTLKYDRNCAEIFPRRRRRYRNPSPLDRRSKETKKTTRKAKQVKADRIFDTNPYEIGPLFRRKQPDDVLSSQVDSGFAENAPGHGQQADDAATETGNDQELPRDEEVRVRVEKFIRAFFSL